KVARLDPVRVKPCETKVSLGRVQHAQHQHRQKRETPKQTHQHRAPPKPGSAPCDPSPDATRVVLRLTHGWIHLPTPTRRPGWSRRSARRTRSRRTRTTGTR